MSDPIILDDDIPGERTLLHRDGKNVVFQRQFDSQPVVDEIQKIKQITNGKSPTGELYHVGRLPAGVVEEYCNLHGVTFHDFCSDPAHVRRLMTDSNYAHLRIWEGRL